MKKRNREYFFRKGFLRTVTKFQHFKRKAELLSFEATIDFSPLDKMLLRSAEDEEDKQSFIDSFEANFYEKFMEAIFKVIQEYERRKNLRLE